MKATTNQADPWKRPNRDDQWARVDYRSRAAAIIGVIAMTLEMSSSSATATTPEKSRRASSWAICEVGRGTSATPSRGGPRTCSLCRWSRRSSGSRPRVVVPCGDGGNNGACRVRVSSTCHRLVQASTFRVC